jgi:hypothetical protein
MTKDNRTNLKTHHGALNRTQQHERGLFLRLAIFMAWVVGIGLLLSLVTCRYASAESGDFRRNESQNIALFGTTAHPKAGFINRTDSYQLAQFAFATDNDKGYYIDLSKISSGQASRHTLAFFVSNICLTSQVKHDTSTTPIYPPRGETVYDGVTSQNKIALGRICGAVSTDTESEPRHPIPLNVNSVTPTQKSVGGHYHA